MDEIYDGAICDKTDFAYEGDLFVNSCGVSKGMGNKFTVIREKGRKDYHIIYVIKGSCIIYQDNSEYVLEPYSFAVYYPGQKQKYTYVEDVYAYWLHFSGKRAEELLKMCELGSGVFHSGENVAVKDTFKKMVHEYCSGSKLSGIKLPALLTELVCELSSSTDVNRKINSCISSLAEYIYTNFRENPDIDFFAKQAAMSRDRFVHLFSSQIGMPPHRFLLNVRMNEATHMLKYTELSIKEIAYGVGFGDALYFSRVFKKYIGLSPKNYKKQIKNH